eukprot:9045284-Lingulodinium_polyedra.AAC.1
MRASWAPCTDRVAEWELHALTASLLRRGSIVCSTERAMPARKAHRRSAVHRLCKWPGAGVASLVGSCF